MNKHYQKHPPNDNRFEEFEEFYDKTGFLIREHNRTIEFFYDHEGGWFDEYGNYYNKNGIPTEPTEQSLEFWEKIRPEYDYLFFDDENDDDYHSEDDDLIKQYEEPIHKDTSVDSDSDDFYSEDEKEENIAILLKKLAQYPPYSEIKIFFTGIRPKCTEEQVKSFFGTDGIKEVNFEMKGKFRTGKGYCIVQNREQAKNVITKYGIELEGEEVRLEIEALKEINSDDEINIFEKNSLDFQSSQKNNKSPIEQYIPKIEVLNIQQEEVIQINGQNSQLTQPDKEIIKSKYVVKQDPNKQITPQTQIDGYDLLFDNIPANVTIKEFDEWLRSKLEITWENLRDRINENKQTKMIKVNFKDIDDALDALEYFHLPNKLMYKGKNKLHLKRMWKD